MAILNYLNSKFPNLLTFHGGGGYFEVLKFKVPISVKFSFSWVYM